MATARKKKSENSILKITIPKKLHFILEEMAKQDLRTVSAQARYLIEVGIQVLSQEGCEEEEECPQDAIGFHVEPSSDEDFDDEDDDEEFEEDKKSKKAPSKRGKK